MASTFNPRLAVRASERVHHYEYVLQARHRFILENGEEPPEMTNRLVLISH